MELRDIVEQARTGDASAFDRLVDAYRDMALGYARTLVRNEQAAEDAVQEALVIAHLKLDGLLDSEAFVGCIRSFVRRRCLHNVKGLAGEYDACSKEAFTMTGATPKKAK